MSNGHVSSIGVSRSAERPPISTETTQQPFEITDNCGLAEKTNRSLKNQSGTPKINEKS